MGWEKHETVEGYLLSEREHSCDPIHNMEMYVNAQITKGLSHLILCITVWLEEGESWSVMFNSCADTFSTVR